MFALKRRMVEWLRGALDLDGRDARVDAAMAAGFCDVRRALGGEIARLSHRVDALERDARVGADDLK